jgi:teichuronic acid exporter
MSDGLKSKTLRGLVWSFLERLGQQGIQFVITIILARLLLPEEFGLIAMLTIFIAVGTTLVESGFAHALLQKRDTTHADECSIFYFNIVLGMAMACILCLAAPWIAVFYERPILVPLTRLLSLNLVIGAFGIVQFASLVRRVDFKTLTKVAMIAALLSGSIGVTMAYRGFGVWSLVSQSLSCNFFITALLWLFHKWRPAWLFSFVSLRSMFPFGSKVMISSLLDIVFNNLYLIVIGKHFSAGDLGFYSRARATQDLLVKNISVTVSRVTFSVFSSVQDDKARLKRGLRKALTTMGMLNFPMMIGLAVVAKPMVFVVLTEKWLPCVHYLQLLCIGGLPYPMHRINLTVLKAQGRSDLLLRIEILQKIMVAIAIVVTYRWGISPMICGGIATSYFGYCMSTYYSAKLLDYPITNQMRDLLPSLVLASVMGGGVYLLHSITFPNELTLLVGQVVLGGALYVSLCHLFKLRSFVEIMDLAKSKLPALQRAI